MNPCLRVGRQPPGPMLLPQYTILIPHSKDFPAQTQHTRRGPGPSIVRSVAQPTLHQRASSSTVPGLPAHADEAWHGPHPHVPDRKPFARRRGHAPCAMGARPGPLPSQARSAASRRSLSRRSATHGPGSSARLHAPALWKQGAWSGTHSMHHVRENTRRGHRSTARTALRLSVCRHGLPLFKTRILSPGKAET